MIKVLIIFSIYLKICTCFYTVINFDVTERDGEKFPWMVVIRNSTSSMVAYGALIHRRAVLTLARMEYNETYFDFQVSAGCLSLGTGLFSEQRCFSTRTVSDYNIIEDNKNDYQKNLAILILSEPFRLSEKIGIVDFSKNDNDFSPDFCIILSLRTMMNGARTHGISRIASLFSSVFVRIHDQTQVNLSLPSNNLSTMDDLGRSESFQMYLNSKYSEMNFAGSPVMCKFSEDFRYWRQIGVANLVLKKNVGTPELVLIGDMIKMNNNEIQEVFQEIIIESTSLLEMLNKYII